MMIRNKLSDEYLIVDCIIHTLDKNYYKNEGTPTSEVLMAMIGAKALPRFKTVCECQEYLESLKAKGVIIEPVEGRLKKV